MPGPTAADFAQNFGLAQLIRKSLAITRDLRMTRNGAAEFVERVLTITGEDTLSIDRNFSAGLDRRAPDPADVPVQRPARHRDGKDGAAALRGVRPGT